MVDVKIVNDYIGYLKSFGLLENDKKYYYKATDNDMVCRGNTEYVMGVKYSLDGEPTLCKNGYHACHELMGVVEFYPLFSRVFVVELGEKLNTVSGDEILNKVCSTEITFLHEIPKKVIYEAYYQSMDSSNYLFGLPRSVYEMTLDKNKEFIDYVIKRGLTFKKHSRIILHPNFKIKELFESNTLGFSDLFAIRKYAKKYKDVKIFNSLYWATNKEIINKIFRR